MQPSRRITCVLASLLLGACGGGAQTLPVDDAPLIARNDGTAEVPRVEGGAAVPAPAPAPPPPVAPALRQALIGEMCPDRGAGRPALSLLVARQVGWSTDPAVLTHLAARVAARPFAVLSGRGTRAGVFEAIGPVELGTEAPVLSGGYAGVAPCERTDKAVDKAADKMLAAACVDAQGKCGLAVASLAVDGVDEPPRLRTGGACVEDTLLRVDLDGDGLAEAFPIAAFLDEVKAPADLVAASATTSAVTCAAAFALPALVRGKDARAFRALDLVGVVDLDDDGRLELVVQYRYAAVRTWAIYVADAKLAQLTLAAEVAPWAAE